MNFKGTKHSEHCFHSEDVLLEVRWERSQVLPVRHPVHLACIVKAILTCALMLPPPWLYIPPLSCHSVLCASMPPVFKHAVRVSWGQTEPTVQGWKREFYFFWLQCESFPVKLSPSAGGLFLWLCTVGCVVEETCLHTGIDQFTLWVLEMVKKKNVSGGEKSKRTQSRKAGNK